MKRRHKKKGKTIKLLEYGAVYTIIFFARKVPLRLIHLISDFLASLLYILVPKRRNIALENLRHAFKEKSEREIKVIARQSFKSFFLTFLEIVKFRHIIASPESIPYCPNPHEPSAHKGK